MLSQPIVLGCLLYAVSAVAWFLSMRHISLAQGAVAYTMFSLIALSVIGALAFGETLRARECAGIACALAAVVLMIRIA